MSLSGVGAVSGQLVNVGLGTEADIPEGGLGGKIALIQRGDVTFDEKVKRVQDAGAVAAVVYNNAAGLFSGQLSTQASIPAVGVSQEDGEFIEGLLEAGQVEGTVSVIVEERESRNVIAEKPGTEPDGGVVVVGGHFDTVPDVPGANDNGSGIAVMIAIAREIAGRTYPFTVRFVPFGAEELGLLGSRHYVSGQSAEEMEDIILMINLDALGTGPSVGLLGDNARVAVLIMYGVDNGIAAGQRFGLRGSSSDHASFQDAGVPVVFFLADDFSRIHTPQDRLEFVQPQLLGEHATLAIALLDMLAAQ
ncbi:MAG: DUF4910 domain-containing protein [Chloroflexi bacterium]|nr:DUF4910 domain-containing protein [Chloroflexota bacterium]